MSETTRTRRKAQGPVVLRLLSQGYQPGIPDNALDSSEVLEAVGIDSAIAASEVCDRCGAKGLAYLPLSKGMAYAGVAVCLSCHAQTEV